MSIILKKLINVAKVHKGSKCWQHQPLYSSIVIQYNAVQSFKTLWHVLEWKWFLSSLPKKVIVKHKVTSRINIVSPCYFLLYFWTEKAEGNIGAFHCPLLLDIANKASVKLWLCDESETSIYELILFFKFLVPII